MCMLARLGVLTQKMEQGYYHHYYYYCCYYCSYSCSCFCCLKSTPFQDDSGAPVLLWTTYITRMFLSQRAAQLTPEHKLAACSSTDKITAAWFYFLSSAWAVRNEHHWAKSPKTGTGALLEMYFYLGTKRQWSKSHIQAYYTVKHIQHNAICQMSICCELSYQRANADWREAEKCSREVNKRKGLKRLTATLV